MPRSRTDAIVIHCTATPFKVGHNRDTIDAMHKARGFSGIGYHYLIGLDGTLYEGRDIDDMGAHVKHFNDSTAAVAYVGGLGPDGSPMDTRNQHQNKTLINLLQTILLKRYPKAVITGHRDYSPDLDKDGVVEPHEYIKQCPCFDAGPWAKSVGLPGARYSYGKYVSL
jgi:N-acetylmuramoyl-L-alanine amidase